MDDGFGGDSDIRENSTKENLERTDHAVARNSIGNGIVVDVGLGLEEA